MKEELLNIKEQLFDASSEVKVAFNQVVKYFDDVTKKLESDLRSYRRQEEDLRRFIDQYGSNPNSRSMYQAQLNRVIDKMNETEEKLYQYKNGKSSYVSNSYDKRDYSPNSYPSKSY